MIRRPPFWATLIVVLSALLMVRLGFWQLHRLREKEALLARYAANLNAPPVALTGFFPVGEGLLYRRASAYCLQPTGWQVESGRSSGGVPGWRHIALCRTGAEGPGFAADVGTSDSPKVPVWQGGPVRGRLTWRPSGAPLIARLIGAEPTPQPMIVAETPAPGLTASAQPDPATVPNNHLSYAVQWFIFAALAIGIYALALWRRGRPVAPPERPR